jgi:hypothetical protein
MSASIEIYTQPRYCSGKDGSDVTSIHYVPQNIQLCREEGMKLRVLATREDLYFLKVQRLGQLGVARVVYHTSMTDNNLCPVCR